MGKFKVAVVSAGCAIALFAGGMTATSWASGDVTAAARPVPDGFVPPSAPHALAAPRPAKPESVFHVITPCRIMDTRVAGGALQPDAIRTYYVGGTFGFAPQGGKSGGCGIPLGATAIAANLTAVTPTHLGNIRAWPNGESEPTATVLPYNAGMNAGTGAALPVSRTATKPLKVKNYHGPTHLFIDVTGYYSEQLEAIIGTDGGLISASSRVVSTKRFATGNYGITFDTDVSNCSAIASADSSQGVYADVYSVGGGDLNVHAWVLNNMTHLEIPGDVFVAVTVTC